MRKYALLIPAIALVFVGAGCASGTPSTPPVSPRPLPPTAAAPAPSVAPAPPTAPQPAPGVVPPGPQGEPQVEPQPAPPSIVPPPPQPAPNAQKDTVTYTDAGFSPAVLTVKVGTTVTFQNSASDDMRVASNPHPVHTGYPTTGGCVGSTFDACRNIAPGTSWTFTFDKVGTWGYHNHLNPGEGGTIVVKQ